METKISTTRGYAPDRGTILSLDLSPSGTGYAVVNFDKNPAWAVAYGTVNHPDGLDSEAQVRRTLRFVRNLIREHRPEAIVHEKVEGVVFAKMRKGSCSYQDGFALVKLVGAVEAKADELRIFNRGLTPEQWKKFCGIPTGRQADRKEQKKASVLAARDRYGLFLIDHNTADALNLCWCYCEKYALPDLRQMRIL